MSGKPLDPETRALLAFCAHTRAKLRYYERSGGPMPTGEQFLRECEEDERREAAENAYFDAKRKAGRASALARARRKANPAAGICDLLAWKRLRELEAEHA